MGMNYFLQEKDKKPFVIPYSGVGHNLELICVGQKLLNQPSVEIDVNKCVCEIEKLHIGKSSAGWKFLLCIYPCLQLYSLKDWENMFNNENFVIVDEEDQIIPPLQMMSIISKRAPADKLEAHKSQLFDPRDQEGMEKFRPVIVTSFTTDGTYDLTLEWDFD